ncbi:MAG TPA: hypothetical protein PLS56_02070 [Candidatus Dojkabacteria bacterium]|nr:hypothetical protein [Candidatus Dojkabacteria bacterium]
MDPYDIIDSLTIDTPKVDFNLFGLLKIPAFIILFANMLFALMMYLRVRILSDTFSSPDNKIVKTVILIHLFVTLIGSLISLLFVVLS